MNNVPKQDLETFLLIKTSHSTTSLFNEMCRAIPALTAFYTAIDSDSRIGISHIALYMALFELYHRNGFHNPVCITRAQVMPMAKFSGVATYHRCMHDLHAFGYIQYSPSYYSKHLSQVVLVNL